MNRVKGKLLSSYACIVIFICIATSALGKPYGPKIKGPSISFDPNRIEVEMALNGAGRQIVSFTSQATFNNINVRIVPEIAPFITIKPSSFEVIEAGQRYELEISFVSPEDILAGCYEGTIHLRQENRTIAKPLPVSIHVLDEWVSLSDWPYRRYDLAATACNPHGSTSYAGTSLTPLFNIPAIDYYLLTGDVDGDWESEIITTSGSTLNIYSGVGELEQSIALPRDCQLSMLEDVDGDGVLDIGLGSRGNGFAAYIYKSDGTLLKTLLGEHGGWYGDHSMIPLTISNGKMLMGYNAGYSRTPRGVASFDYDTGIEEWYYQVGPANGWYSVVDMDLNGVLDITMNSHTVHNGASGNGTTDGDIYLMVIDELGVSSLTQKYPSPSNGWAHHIFADMDGDGMQEILGFEGHDSRYYPGQAQIHIYDNTGNTLYTFNGPSNTGWDYAVGDLDGDDVPEVVASARTANQVYVLDNELQLLSSTTVAGNVKLICDLTGDGNKEIVLLTSDGLLKVLDSSLSLIDEVQCGDKNGNVIASDVNGDGVVELLVQTDQLYVLSFAKDTMSANETSYESVPVVDILSVRAIVEADEADAVSDLSDSQAGDEFHEQKSHFTLISSRFTWDEANTDADVRGGHLATFASQAEWDEMVEQVGTSALSKSDTWIGGTDERKEGVWEWVTGEPFEFSRWDPRQPDNSAWGNRKIHQNYIVIIPYNLLWDDRGSVERTLVPRFPYILEVEQNDLESGGTLAEVEIYRLGAD